MMNITHIDCTLRDGGYYNNWDFSEDVIIHYLAAMSKAGVDIVELGFRSLDTSVYRGACAYTTDSFIESLPIPQNLNVGVMINASELVSHPEGVEEALCSLFAPSSSSNVSLVRIACHAHEVANVLPACEWLNLQGYSVGLNFMQIGNLTRIEIQELARLVANSGIEVLYFADSLGSMDPVQTADVVEALQSVWKGPLGIHTHDNLGLALANSLKAIECGVTWVDSTVTGMGRGPGNAQTEFLVIELDCLFKRNVELEPLLVLIDEYFNALKAEYGWGKNPYYYLAGKHGIHPTFVQEMLSDSRFSQADTLSNIDFIRQNEGSRYNVATIEMARNSIVGVSTGSWTPSETLAGREVLIVGSGPSVRKHRTSIVDYIKKNTPYVIVLNTNSMLDSDLIDLRAACHPLRLIADYKEYEGLSGPIVAPLGQLEKEVRESLDLSNCFDFGIDVSAGMFEFKETSVSVPAPLGIAYVLGIVTSGKAKKVFLAGFDGYAVDDVRNKEMDEIFSLYCAKNEALPLRAITPTMYKVRSTSVYAMLNQK